MDTCGFQRFIQGKRWKDAAQPLGQHTLARARWADQDQVVSACCGNFQGAFHCFLPLHLLQIAAVGLSRCEQYLRIHAHGQEGGGAGQKLDRLTQGFHRDHFQPLHHGGFRCVICGYEQSSSPFGASCQRNGQHAFYSAYLTGQRQFSCQRIQLRAFGRSLFTGHQPRQRDGQIKAWPFLA